MLSLCVKALEHGLMLKYHPGVHTIEVQTQSGLYWARVWANEDGTVCIVADMNGQMIEDAPWGGTWIDIGANVGRYSIPMSVKADIVLAFEPEPKNFERLKEHTELNPKIHPAEFALSNYNGKAEMHLSGRWGEHSLRKELVGSFDEIKGTVEVNCVTLDYILKELKTKDITAIKIDVEGAEGEVLEGAVETLRNHCPLIVLETHMHADLDKSTDILQSLDYEIMASNGQIIDRLIPDIQVICRKVK